MRGSNTAKRSLPPSDWKLDGSAWKILGSSPGYSPFFRKKVKFGVAKSEVILMYYEGIYKIIPNQ